MIVVRPAHHGDIDWLISQLKDFSAFFGSKKPLFSSDEFARMGLENLMQHHLILVAQDTKADCLVGFIAGLVSPHIFNPSIKVLAEAFWWVPEEYRRTRAGLLLLNEFVKWGRHNADWITFTLEAKSPINDGALIRRGFALQESNYLLEVA